MAPGKDEMLQALSELPEDHLDEIVRACEDRLHTRNLLDALSPEGQREIKRETALRRTYRMTAITDDFQMSLQDIETGEMRSDLNLLEGEESAHQEQRARLLTSLRAPGSIHLVTLRQEEIVVTEHYPDGAAAPGASG